MRSDKINYVLVGGFVIAILLALVGAIAVLTGRTGVTDTYYTHYDDATGLKYGSKVLYMGFPVGQVESIEPVLENGKLSFQLELSIDDTFRDWNVPDDSVAEVRAAGLLAAVTIDIRAGESETPLAPGATIRGRGRADVFDAVSDTANTLRELTQTSVRPLLENLNRHVGSVGEVLQDRGGPLLDNLSVLTGQLAERAPEIIDDFLRTTADLRTVSGRLGALLSDDNAGRVDSVLENFVGASQEVLTLTRNARTQLDVLFGSAMVARMTQTIKDVGVAASDVRAVSGSARARLFSQDNVNGLARTIDNLEDASASVRSMVDESARASVERTLGNVETASASLESLIADTRVQVNSLIGPDTSEKLDRALDNMSKASASIAELSDALDARLGEVLTPQMVSRLKQALENFSNASQNIAALSGGLNQSRRRLDTVLDNLKSVAEENRPDLRASMRHLRHSLRAISQNIDSVATNLDGTSRNLYELSRRLKANPGLLLRTPARQDGLGAASGG